VVPLVPRFTTGYHLGSLPGRQGNRAIERRTKNDATPWNSSISAYTPRRHEFGNTGLTRRREGFRAEKLARPPRESEMMAARSIRGLSGNAEIRGGLQEHPDLNGERDERRCEREATDERADFASSALLFSGLDP